MIKLIVTCEHGGNKIPGKFKYLFNEQSEVLNSHRGYDIGALEIFNNIKSLSDFNFSSQTSRLLIELNRSLHHTNLFSSYTKQLDKKLKQEIIEKYYQPYRNEVENKIDDFLNTGYRVIHVSVHTFTPVLNNEVRNCDIGLLYNPQHKKEKLFCADFKRNIISACNYKVRFNYPYLGIADGFTSYLRKKFNSKNYMGIELEVNQKFRFTEEKEKQLLIKALKTSLQKTVTNSTKLF